MSPLEAPAGLVVVLGGSGESPLQRTSDAVAATTLSAAALEAHYARHLEAAGWQRTAGGMSGPLAWSVWRVPQGEADPARLGFVLAPGEREGFLAVLEGPGPERRSLHVQVSSAGSLTGPDPSVGVAPAVVPTAPPPPR